jgi:hypothetical protein
VSRWEQTAPEAGEIDFGAEAEVELAAVPDAEVVVAQAEPVAVEC